MLQLAEIFQDGMVLQRNKPCRIWGNSLEHQTISICIDGKKVMEKEIPKGQFSFFIPAQEQAENVTVLIGDIEIKNVDFGEVWVAGGQSNMEFAMKCDRRFEEMKEPEADNHLRYYEVAKYCFEGEKKDGLKDDSGWNCWKTLSGETIGDFSAVAVYFAMELREKYKVPIAIVSCNWGGTSASSWISRELLDADDETAVYLREYEEKLAGMNLEEYYQKNYALRKSMSSEFARMSSDYMLKNTVTLEEIIQYSMELAVKAGYDMEKLAEEGSGRTAEDFAMIGPHDANRPCGLYENMLSKIAGFSARGVIWYQGESDVTHPGIYEKLFALLIRQLRMDWGGDIPVIYAQIAPFETWMQSSGEHFPEIRQQQFDAWQHIKSIYMVSTSDCGNQYDIHPKDKKPVGVRMALSAMQHVYHENVQGDAPFAEEAVLQDEKVEIIFSNAERLTVDGEEIQAIKILSDGKEMRITGWETEGNMLVLMTDRKADSGKLRIEFAQTPYYQVNLYNEQGLPAFPFVLCG